MITCTIYSKKTTISYPDVHGVSVPTLSGRAEILTGHAEFFALTSKGKAVFIKKDGSKESLDIEAGFCRFNHKKNSLAILF